MVFVIGLIVKFVIRYIKYEIQNLMYLRIGNWCLKIFEVFRIGIAVSAVFRSIRKFSTPNLMS